MIFIPKDLFLSPSSSARGKAWRASAPPMLELWLAGSCASLVPVSIADVHSSVHWPHQVQKTAFLSLCHILPSLHSFYILFLRVFWALRMGDWYRGHVCGWKEKSGPLIGLLLVFIWCVEGGMWLNSFIFGNLRILPQYFEQTILSSFSRLETLTKPTDSGYICLFLDSDFSPICLCLALMSILSV